ncbi:DUF6404 family protein [Microbulbifer sp.]|uniref:DUF6404 family protein n=1 Tax=Microbulbifer sp. TaxID=1908541 RepID=UPI003F2E88C3
MNPTEKYEKAVKILVEIGVEKRAIVPPYVQFLASLGFEVKHPLYVPIYYNYVRYFIQLLFPVAIGIGVSALFERNINLKVWVAVVIFLPLVFSVYDWSRTAGQKLPHWEEL